MSGKLIMKRKLDKAQHVPLPSCNKLVPGESSKLSTISSSTSASSTKAKSDNNKDNDQDDVSVGQPENKRARGDTPPSSESEEDSNLPSLPQVTQCNRHLLEAIQSKMLELQNELDEFEHDVEAHEEDYYYRHEQLSNHHQISEQDAETLGFAMCAQETMLFLQREGIPSDSLLYTRLRDALVGRSFTSR